MTFRERSPERSRKNYCRLGDGHSERFVHATTRRRDRGDGGVNGTTRTVEGIFVVKSTRRLALEGWGARFRSAILFDAGSGNLPREKRPVDRSTGAESVLSRATRRCLFACARGASMRTRAGGGLQVTGRCGGRDACGRASGSVPRAEGNEPLSVHTARSAPPALRPSVVGRRGPAAYLV